MFLDSFSPLSGFNVSQAIFNPISFIWIAYGFSPLSGFNVSQVSRNFRKVSWYQEVSVPYRGLMSRKSRQNQRTNFLTLVSVPYRGLMSRKTWFEKAHNYYSHSLFCGADTFSTFILPIIFSLSLSIRMAKPTGLIYYF